MSLRAKRVHTKQNRKKKQIQEMQKKIRSIQQQTARQGFFKAWFVYHMAKLTDLSHPDIIAL